MTGRPPNVLYLHSHDTGRHLEPYGYPVPTPNITQLANQGIVFREAFCAVPTCSGSRAALLTGQYGHSNEIGRASCRGRVASSGGSGSSYKQPDTARGWRTPAGRA